MDEQPVNQAILCLFDFVYSENPAWPVYLVVTVHTSDMRRLSFLDPDHMRYSNAVVCDVVIVFVLLLFAVHTISNSRPAFNGRKNLLVFLGERALRKFRSFASVPPSTYRDDQDMIMIL